MGLDATIYCDCFEKGRLRCAPPNGGKLRVDPDGSLCRPECSGRIEDDIAFDRWLRDSTCAHPTGVLLHHRLGNIDSIALLRSALGRDARRFPILLGKVIYDGTHCGDFIPVSDLPALREEVGRLPALQNSRDDSSEFVAQFAVQMGELVETALTVQKPISF